MDILEKSINGAADGFSGDVTGLSRQCELLTQGNPSKQEILARLDQALALVADAPREAAPQVAAMRLFELSRQKANMLDSWTGLLRRFPDNALALRMRMRWLRRENRVEEGRAELEAIARAGRKTSVLADQFAELGLHGRTDELYGQLVDASPDNRKLKLCWAKHLLARGEIDRVAALLGDIPREGMSAAAQAIISQIEVSRRAQSIVEPRFLDTMNLNSAALHQAIMAYSDRVVPRSVSPHLGGISFVTGSLGAGGAEKQLTRLACALHALQCREIPVGNVMLKAAVEMVISNVSSAAGNDFFLPQAQEAGINLVDVSEMPVEPLSEVGLPAGTVRDLAPALPKNALFGLQRLVAHFRRNKPEVVYIWQDGAVLMAALAALVAQVPRIVISVRGMPPSIRQNLAKDEFLGMYQALARVPGVSLSSNSRAAADAYADWIGLPRQSFFVIHNAIQPESCQATEDEKRLWQDFDAQTSDATHTLGGVFRFEPNKRPLLWVRFAAEAYQRDRGLRFVLVGSGALLEQAQALARDLGIGHRIHFVGHSHHVGFWLSKFDLLALLSEYEGLPNVLMEAQLAGIPVISTPAGGANETFVDGQTGYVLDSSAEPDIMDFLSKLELTVANPARRALMGKFARLQATQRFSIDSVLDQTIQMFKGTPTFADAAQKAVQIPLAKNA